MYRLLFRSRPRLEGRTVAARRAAPDCSRKYFAIASNCDPDAPPWLRIEADALLVIASQRELTVAKKSASALSSFRRAALVSGSPRSIFLMKFSCATHVSAHDNIFSAQSPPPKRSKRFPRVALGNLNSSINPAGTLEEGMALPCKGKRLTNGFPSH